MASLTYTDIETRVMNQLRLPTSNATEQAKIQALINQVYRDIFAKHDWWWCVERTVINTLDDQTNGTVNVTNASASITFSATKTPSVVRHVFMVDGNTRDAGAVYRVATHTAGTASATLDAAYTGDTNTTASYRLYRDTYDLPSDCSKVLHIRTYGYHTPLMMISPSEMYDLKAYDLSVGKPRLASVWDFQTTGDPTTVRQLVVHPYPDNTYRMELHFKQALNTELTGSTQPRIPDDYRELLVYGALARGYPIFLNDLDRGKYYQALFNDMLILMVAAQREYQNENPRIQVRDQYRAFYTRGRRVSPARVDMGSWFDRWPSEP